MKRRYFNLSTRAIVECDPCDEAGIDVPEPTRTWRICRVMAPTQGQGHGTEVLQQCCDDADAEGIILTLEAIPYQRDRLDDLLRFYRRFGFEFGPDEDTIQLGFRYPR